MISESELFELNEELRREDIAPGVRPWEAMRRISQRTKRSIDFPSAEANFIFEWFKLNTKPGSQEMGHLYQGAYYYDSTFWGVSLPITFGIVIINARDALYNMPDTIKKILANDKKAVNDYAFFWANCVDFGSTYEELYKDKNYDSFGRQLLNAGYEELSSATTLLLENRPNKRAILNCRMATEMLLKCFIAFKVGLSENQAKKIGHDLNELFNKFLEVSGNHNLSKIKDVLQVFPDIHERYKPQNIDNKSLFKGYCFAQFIGAVIARTFTDQDALSQIMSSKKADSHDKFF